MNKIVYIIPGFHGSAKMIRYKRIIAEFRKRGFKTSPIKITWDRRVMSDYVAEFLKQIHHNKNDKVYIFGFSLGAMIAFIVAKQVKPKALVLCSLSPFFEEDLRFVKKSWKKYLGKNRLKDFEKFSFEKIAKRNKKYKAYLLVGEKEDKTLSQKVKKAHQALCKSEVVIIKNAKHNIKDSKYLREISRAIDTL
jgi:esterase/lipase